MLNVPKVRDRLNERILSEDEVARIAWHSGWDPEHGSSALLMWLPERRLGFAVLANGEGVWWDNPLREAAVERSDFAQAFLERFVFGDEGAR